MQLLKTSLQKCTGAVNLMISFCYLALKQWKARSMVTTKHHTSDEVLKPLMYWQLLWHQLDVYHRKNVQLIRCAINPKLTYDFRSNRTTLMQALALSHIIEEVRWNNLSGVLTFIDFKKAFNSINHNKMMRILKAYGIPKNLLRDTQTLYTNTRTKGTTPDGEMGKRIWDSSRSAPSWYICVFPSSHHTGPYAS